MSALHYLRARKAGHSHEDLMQAALQREKAALDEQVHQKVVMMAEYGIDSAEQYAGCIDRFERRDGFELSREFLTALQGRMEELRQLNLELKESATTQRGNLKDLIKRVDKLREELEWLKKHGPPPGHNVLELCQIGDALCRRIAKGRRDERNRE